MDTKIFDKIIKILIENDNVLSIALGGSRSRNTHNEYSDFDIFCLIKNESFLNFKNSLSDIIENNIKEILVFVEMYYLENWGYLFKGIDNKGNYYDLSIISANRINEISIRSTNILLKDTKDLYKNAILNADDSQFDPNNQLLLLENDFNKIFYINLCRFMKSYYKNEYWMMIRYLERMKRSLLIRFRTVNNIPTSSLVIPEKSIEDELKDFNLKQYYTIDGTMVGLVKCGKYMINEYRKTLKNDDIIKKLIQINDLENIFSKDL